MRRADRARARAREHDQRARSAGLAAGPRLGVADAAVKLRSFPRKRESVARMSEAICGASRISLTLIRATKPWVPAGVHPRESGGGDERREPPRARPRGGARGDVTNSQARTRRRQPCNATDG